MSNPLEQYRQWERDAPGTTCHVMVIDRGDGSPEHRLTLTDKPYRDKGVDGVKYHHTYPAPIQCIVSDIVTDEQRDGTSYEKITIANVGGALDNIITGDNAILYQKFTIYRGDTRWSILSKDFPWRFIDIVHGRITKAVPLKAGSLIEIEIAPLDYQLDNEVTQKNQPFSIGYCWNAPLLLHDEPSHQYQFSSAQLFNGAPEAQEIMARGVLLAYGTDYNTVLEEGEFRGRYEFVTAPAMPLTASVRPYGGLFESYSSPFYHSASLIRDFSDADLGYINEGDAEWASIPGGWDIRIVAMLFNGDGTKLFLLGNSGLPGDGRGVLRRYSIVGDDILSGITYENAYLDLEPLMPDLATTTDEQIMFSSTGMSLFVQVHFGSLGIRIYRLSLSAPYDIESAVVAESVSFDYNGFGWQFVGQTDSFLIVSSGASFDALAIESPDSLPTQGPQLPGMAPSRASKGFYACLTPDKRSAFLAGFDIYNSSIVNVVDLFDNQASGYLFKKESIHLSRGDLLDFPYGISLHPSGAALYVYGSQGFRQVSLTGARVYSAADYIYYGDLENIRSGAFYSSGVSIGTVITDLCSVIDGGWSVDRYGALSIFQVLDPEEDTSDISVFAPSHHVLGIGDVIGAGGLDSVVMENVIPASTRIAITYGPNYYTLTDSDIAGSVGAELREALKSTAFSLVIDEAPAPGRPVVESVTQTSYYTTFGGTAPRIPSNTKPTGIAAMQKQTWGVDRFMYTAKCRLAPLAPSRNCFLADIISFDFSGPGFAAGDKFQLHGRRMNWSKNTQELRLFK